MFCSVNSKYGNVHITLHRIFYYGTFFIVHQTSVKSNVRLTSFKGDAGNGGKWRLTQYAICSPFNKNLYSGLVKYFTCRCDDFIKSLRTFTTQIAARVFTGGSDEIESQLLSSRQ